MLDVLFYDDDAEETNSSYPQVAALVKVVRSTLGPGANLNVVSSALIAREWIRRRTRAQRPALLVLDVMNKKHETWLSKPSPAEHENSGLLLAELAYEKWPGVRIVYLTRLDGASEEADEALEFEEVHRWVEKTAFGTETRLRNSLTAWFSDRPTVQVGNLLLVNRELSIYWHQQRMRLGSNVKTKANKNDKANNDQIWLTPGMYHFLRTLMVKTAEKRDDPKCPSKCVTIEELRADESQEEGAVTAMKHEVCKRLGRAEKRHQQENGLVDAELNCDTVIVSCDGGYMLVEE